MVQWKVCVDVQGWDDVCSDYATHASGPNGMPIQLYCADPPTAGRAAACEYATNPPGDGWRLTAQCLAKIGEEIALKPLEDLREAEARKALGAIGYGKFAARVFGPTKVAITLYEGYEITVDCR